ncbi:MAG TPA: H-type lectin domain-containing protein, partial [Chitinolyticbacter sp.]|nr:H-type lectin domain-containing protein [Chitinolyticbacter sp.]
VDGDLQIKGTHKIHCPARLHISGDELLYLLNKSGVVIGKEWGGNGKLTVQGELAAQGGITFGDGSQQAGAVVVRGGTWESGGRMEKTTKYINVSYSGFRNIPTVLVSLSFVDAEQSRNLRLNSWADSVTASGCRLAIHTWADTVIYGASGTWIAFGN